MKSSHRQREMLNTLVNKRSKEQTRTITLKRKTVVRAPARSRAISGENNLATEGSSSTRASFIFRPPMTRQRALSAKFKHFSEVKKRGERSIVVGKASSADSFDSPPPPLPPIPDRAQEAIVLYGHRWVQLGYLAMLALISDWVCFSVAATPDRWDAIFHRSPEALIDVFLFTNVAFCFLEPQIVGKFGLRNVVVGAAVLMTCGCALRSGLAFDNFLPFTSVMPSYTEEVIGTIMVGAAQPFFQCTPTLLSSRWFGKDERALSTSIAINANQIGIAVAFIVGGLMATDSNEGLNGYFSLITLLSAIVTVGAFFQFQEKPPTPPSLSQVQQEKERIQRLNEAAVLEATTIDVNAAAASIIGNKKIEEDSTALNFPALCKRLLKTPGFWQPTAAFVASIAISNNVSAFIGTTLSKAGIEDAFEVDEFGAAFQIAIMIGSIFLGGYVDRSKSYKPVSVALIIISILLLIPIGAGSSIDHNIVLFSLVLLGFTVGPVQPICAELAVEVSYPEDESGVVALQQVCGNLFSAILVPILAIAANQDLVFGKVSGDYAILVVIGLITLVYFVTFSAPLKRLEADRAAE